VYLRGDRVPIEPGDIAYFPERVPHALRNPKGNSQNFVVVNQICPPQFRLAPLRDSPSAAKCLAIELCNALTIGTAG